MAAAVVLAALVAEVVPAGAQSPIRIGASISLTGTYAKPGTYQKEGYEVCVDEVNAKGGLLGRKIEFVLYDDQSLPATAVKLYEKLITEDKVEAVMGPYSSAVSEAVANVTEKYKKVMVAPLAATTSIFRKGRKYIFMVVSPAEVYLDGLVDMARQARAQDHGHRERGHAVPQGLGGRAWRSWRRSAACRWCSRRRIPKGNTDFSALLVKIKSLNPDVIAAGTYFDDAVALTRQMKELNVNPKMFGLTVGGDLPEFYDLLKQNAEYVYGATQWDGSMPYPGQKEFLAAYQKKFKREPSYHAAAGYAGCLIYVEAARKAGTLDSDKVREELLKLKTRNAFGDYAVDQDGFQTAHKMAMLQWQDGKRVIVWPEDLSDGKPRYPTPGLEPALSRLRRPRRRLPLPSRERAGVRVATRAVAIVSPLTLPSPLKGERDVHNAF